MRSDVRLEDEPETPADIGLVSRIRAAVAERQLRTIDALIGLLQRRRNRIEPPADPADARRGSRHGAAEHGALTLDGAGAAKPGRLRGVLIVLALLLATAFVSVIFSYGLLSRSIKADALIIDDLRDQVAQMEKVDARSVAIQAKSQQQIAENKKAMREYEAAIQGYEEQVAQLRQRLDAATPKPRKEAARPVAARRNARTAPEKTGNCVMDAANAAADLTRCVEEFNRK